MSMLDHDSPLREAKFPKLPQLSGSAIDIASKLEAQATAEFLASNDEAARLLRDGAKAICVLARQVHDLSLASQR